MHGKTTSAGRQHTGGHPRLTASQAALGHVASFAAQWPLRSFLELGALPGAVPCARLHTRQVLWEWGLGAFSASTELLVSELVTNAMQISQATAQYAPVRVWVVSDRAQVVIFVWDASPLPPVPAAADSDAENGRGLLIIQAISAQWGWDFPPGLGGKVVWRRSARNEKGKAMHMTRKSGRWLPVRIDDFEKWQACLLEESARRLGAVLAPGGRVHR